MKRSKHSLSHYKLATFDMGELVPVGVYDVLPGDSIQQATSALLRVSPLNAPVMHPVSVRIHHWFVPYRILWDDWEDFITGGPDGDDTSAIPRVVQNFSAGQLGDYFGIRPGTAVGVVAFPFRAYNLIYNEYYRDQDLVDPRPVPTDGGTDSTSPVTLAKVAWEKDYFTSARPWPQKGPEITLPLGTDAPLVQRNPSPGGLSWRVRRADNGAIATVGGGISSQNTSGNLIDDSNTLAYRLDPNGTLVADLSDATAVDINTVRRAFALQRYQEARAQYGSRYTEYLRYLGVRSSDARLQRPEYLGGGKQTISFSEVLQTAPTSDGNDDGIGNLKGHGIAAMRSRRYRRFFEEHGVVLSLMSVRPRTIYADGINKMWIKETREDFWQRELELIGQQEIKNVEVRLAHASPSGTFGYQDRYAEYRHIPSTIAAEFRNTLDFWHMARLFGSDPALNESFITCDPTKRINQVQTNDTLWCMINHSIQARRLVSKGGRPGRII